MGVPLADIEIQFGLWVVFKVMVSFSPLPDIQASFSTRYLGHFMRNCPQCHGLGQNEWPHLRRSIHSICLFFVWRQIIPFFSEIQQIWYLILKIQGQCHGQRQNWLPHLRPRIKSIYLFFYLWPFSWDVVSLRMYPKLSQIPVFNGVILDNS